VTGRWFPPPIKLTAARCVKKFTFYWHENNSIKHENSPSSVIKCWWLNTNQTINILVILFIVVALANFVHSATDELSTLMTSLWHGDVNAATTRDLHYAYQHHTDTHSTTDNAPQRYLQYDWVSLMVVKRGMSTEEREIKLNFTMNEK